MDRHGAVRGALVLLSANVPINGLVNLQFVPNNWHSSEVCFFLFFFWGGGVLKNEIRFKVISISSHSLDFEYALMSLTKRALIASPPGIAQSLSHVLFMPAVNSICKLFHQCAMAQNCPHRTTPGGSTPPVV